MAKEKIKMKLNSDLTRYQSIIFRNMCKFIVALIALTSVIVCVPITILLFLPLRSFVYVCAKIFRPDIKRFLNPPSSPFALRDSSPPDKVNICFFFIPDEYIDLSDFRSLFQKRVIEKLGSNGRLMYPELKQFWISFLSYTVLKKDKAFGLKNNVRIFDYNYDYDDDADLFKKHSNHSQEHGEFWSKKRLQGMLGPLMERSWTVGRSPWEVLLVQNYKREENNTDSLESNNVKPSTAIIFRIHHGLADGYTTQKIMVRDLMLTPIDFKINFPTWNIWETVLFYAILLFKLPWDFAEILLNGVDRTNCWRLWGRNKLSRNVLTSTSKPIDIQVIKNVRNKYRAGYNAVLCNSTANAYRRLMVEANQVVPKEIKCMIPFPLRNHPDGLVNHVTMDFCPWPMNTKMKNEERLLFISNKMSPSKYYTGPYAINLLISLMSIYPNPIVNILTLMASPFTVAFTSLPFPKKIVFSGLDVKIVDAWFGVGPGMGLGGGLIISLVSANGKQRITGMIDKSIFPWELIFEKFGEYVEEELMKLSESPTMDNNQTYIGKND